ncbi:hypothetical protein [Pseudobacteriovorax antillogorgiicola]|uniref:Uncharacterized protein n=1 Tax=Pseudobacteriovorax antillogorgiicola TaxID=1513793 RepID=A0A1Y6CHB2_9BACT|nr:hypothetical protein [Pseudobacteriovorax antillogorgiicola]TCS48651.1 hypothetical protein EDD56_11773 [Pseudobacteriovorax antillogorgiicola]SMF55173.1 hypothetical protein SAMN06296036_11786 [Pseudobacteriovorax antillogorgiicola]
MKFIPKKSQRQIVASIVASASLGSSVSYGIPSNSNQVSILSTLQAKARAESEVLKGVAIFSDSEVDQTIYVSPANKRRVGSLFQLTDAPNCNAYEASFRTTYVYPSNIDNISSEELKTYAQSPFSPYFDMKYGNYVRYQTILDRLANTLVEASETDLSDPTFSIKINNITALSNLFATFNETAAKTFKVAKLDTDTQSNKVVGKGNAAWTVWGNEEAELQNVVNALGSRNIDYRNLNVRRLPIFDIRSQISFSLERQPEQTLNPLGDLVDNTVPNPSPAPDTLPPESPVPLPSNSVPLPTIETGTFGGAPLNENLTDDATVSSALTAKDPQTGEDMAVKVKTNTPKNNGAGVISIPISQGALCAIPALRTALVSVPKYGPVQSSVQPLVFSDFTRRNTSLLAQTVALNYSYYLRTEPTKVSCTLDGAKFQSFLSTKKNSGFLFWRKKKSSETFTDIQKAGISCTVFESPGNGINVEDLRQKFSQEIAAEYLTQISGFSYKVDTSPAVLPTEHQRFFNDAGSAMKGLCGTNPYCQIGAIAIQNAPQLFGSTSAGRNVTVNRDFKFYRNYDYTGFTVEPSSSTIEIFFE